MVLFLQRFFKFCCVYRCTPCYPSRSCKPMKSFYRVASSCNQYNFSKLKISHPSRTKIWNCQGIKVSCFKYHVNGWILKTFYTRNTTCFFLSHKNWTSQDKYLFFIACDSELVTCYLSTNQDLVHIVSTSHGIFFYASLLGRQPITWHDIFD